mgnify:CR=1 FL=1
MGRLESYFDFAENDYKFFMAAYKNHMVANQMGAIAQGICEKYLKHIITEYIVPKSNEENYSKNTILRTHSLTKLLKYIRQSLPDFEIDKKQIQAIDGYYFTTRYPGDDSITIDEVDIEDCKMAIEECREKVFTYVKKIEKERKEDLKRDKSSIEIGPKL